jgi:tRNA U34 5-carboxymethylaminomethyl modifying enzyme MnmG/GidA
MLDIFYDNNQFDKLHKKQSMNAYKTYNTVSDVCELLIYQHMPYHVFDVMWENIERMDRYIYEDLEEKFYYVDYIQRGSYKKKNNHKKKRLKINKAIRYMCL